MASEPPNDARPRRRGNWIPWAGLCASLAFVGCLVIGYLITMALADNAVRGWYAPDVQDALARDSVRFGWVCPGLCLSLFVSAAVATLVGWMMRNRA